MKIASVGYVALSAAPRFKAHLPGLRGLFVRPDMTQSAERHFKAEELHLENQIAAQMRPGGGYQGWRRRTNAQHALAVLNVAKTQGELGIAAVTYLALENSIRRETPWLSRQMLQNTWSLRQNLLTDFEALGVAGPQLKMAATHLQNVFARHHLAALYPMSNAGVHVDYMVSPYQEIARQYLPKAPGA